MTTGPVGMTTTTTTMMRDIITTGFAYSSGVVDNNDPKQQQQQQHHPEHHYNHNQRTAALAVQQQQQLQQENLHLRQRLALMQGEYEELQDESNYHKAKVAELSDILGHRVAAAAAATTTPGGNNKSGHRGGELLLQEALIEKAAHGAALTLRVAKLQSQAKDRDVQIEGLIRERQENKRLLLEMGDIVRTLSSVHISYDTTTTSSSFYGGDGDGDGPATMAAAATGSAYLGSQQVAIKKIKRKVEAIMSDRSLLVRRCRELEEETAEQQEKIRALEVQFHLLNSANLAKAAAVGGGGGEDGGGGGGHHHHHQYTTASPITATTAVDTPSSFSISTKATPMSPLRNCRHPNDDDDDDDVYDEYDDDDDAVSIGAAADQSMNSCKTKGTMLLLREQQRAHEEQRETLRREHEERTEQLQAESERAYERVGRLEGELQKAREDVEDAVIKRDEYRESLRDIILQYKDLHAEHEETTARLVAVQRSLDELENETQTRRELESEVERSVHHAVQEGLVANMDDVIAAYSRSVERIASLEARLEMAENQADAACHQKDSGDRKFRDAVARSRKLEHERNQFQILLDKAREDTRKAKIEAQKEREEAKHVRRRLTLYMKSANGNGSTSPLRPSSTPTRQLSIPDLTKAAVSLSADPSSVTFGRWMQQSDKLKAETQRLVRENQELKTFCEELLNEVAAKDSQQ